MPHDDLQSNGFSLIGKPKLPVPLAELADEFTRLIGSDDRACARHVMEHSEVLRKLSVSPEILQLLPTGLLPVRCILFDKTPQQNWPVAWHQDLTIAVKEARDVAGFSNWSVKAGVTHVQPPVGLLEKMVTLPLHLDHTSLDNGALKIVAGSHRLGKIPSTDIAQFTEKESLHCDCRAGDVLLMKPLILHASDRSKSPAHRRVIHIEYADRKSLHPDLQWHQELIPQ